MDETIKLYQGDCLEIFDSIDDNSIDLILTDPPYLISRNSNFSKGGGDIKKYGMISIDFGEWDKKLLDNNYLFSQYYRILKKGGTLITFYDIFKITELFDVAKSLKFKQPRIGIWNKTNAVPINAKINYLSNAREYFISFCKGKKKTFNSYYDRAYYEYPIVGGREKTKHPTQKPIKLMEDLIKIHSNEGDIIFDPFMGSGSTGVDCKNLNRKFIGIELDENYFQIAKKE